MQTRQLRDSRSATVGATGTATVQFGPTRGNTRWTITRVGVMTTTNTSEPTARVYHGGPGAASFITGTYTGSQDTDSAMSEELFTGDFLTVQWTGADVGATATATFTYEETTGAG